MTTQEINLIKALKAQNYSDETIARLVGSSERAVKVFCQRHGIKANGPPKTKVENESLRRCKYCGKLIRQKTIREKEYCSSYCRKKAWLLRKRQEKEENSQKRLDFQPLLSDEWCSGETASLKT